MGKWAVRYPAFRALYLCSRDRQEFLDRTKHYRQGG